MWGRVLGVECGGQLFVAERLDHLDHAPHAGGCLGMADVGLQRADPQRPSATRTVAQGTGERVGLDRIAQHRRGAVRLDGVDVGGREASIAQCLANQALLCGPARRREAVACPVLVDGAAADHGLNLVAASERPRERLQDDHTDALGPAGAVGVGRERAAAAVRRERTVSAELDERAGIRKHRDAAGQRNGGLAPPQRLAREVDRHERGRACGVHGDGGPLEAEVMGDPSGGNAARVAEPESALQRLGQRPDECPIVVVRGETDEHSGGAPVQLEWIDAGVRQRRPGGLQQEPLLWIGGQRLTLAEAEEVDVERAGVREETAAAGVGAAHVIGIGVVDALEVPPPIGGKRGCAIDAPLDELPQLGRRADPARIAAAHAEDRDRLAARVSRPRRPRHRCGLVRRP
jgi:hypothetical protein